MGTFYKEKSFGHVFTLKRVLPFLGALNVAAVLVDARLASGYLTSRAGIYAAPRTLREGQSMTAEHLAEVLRRAGYVEGEGSRVWNGRFKAEREAVYIFTSEAA